MNGSRLWKESKIHGAVNRTSNENYEIGQTFSSLYTGAVHGICWFGILFLFGLPVVRMKDVPKMMER
jgi:hypothetical protein